MLLKDAQDRLFFRVDAADGSLLGGDATLPSPPRAASCALRCSTIVRAAFSSGTTRRMSPACGTSDRPRTTAGVAGPAFVIRFPLSFSRARTFPTT